MGALLLSSCAVPIADMQFCSPVPGNLGAACDNFLTSNPVFLSEADWIALQATWVAQGNAVECTTSSAVGSIKEAIEKLCSETPCTYQQLTQILGQISDKMEALR